MKAQQKRGNQEEGNNKEGDDIIQPTPEFEKKERERTLKRFERRKSCATVTPKVSSLKKKVEKNKTKNKQAILNLNNEQNMLFVIAEAMLFSAEFKY